MAPVQLAIVSPAHGSVLLDGSVTLSGRVVSAPPELAGVPLFYRWYSSLFPATATRISINPAALTDPATPLAATLGLGRNVLSVGASEQGAEAAIKDSAHGGVAGGDTGPTACVVTVLAATIIAPAAGATVSRAAVTLVARAPDRAYPAPPTGHPALDRLRYRWTLTPQGGGAAVTVAGPGLPAESGFVAITFTPAAAPAPPFARATYTGALPGLALGPCRVKLRVEAIDNPTLGAEAEVQVVIAA